MLQRDGMFYGYVLVVCFVADVHCQWYTLLIYIMSLTKNGISNLSSFGGDTVRQWGL